MTPTWADVKAAWSAGWQALSASAGSTYAAMVAADPTGTASRANGFVAALTETRATLDRIRVKLPPDDPVLAARVADLDRRWHDLAAGLFADAVPAQPAVGVAPLLIVGGLVITAVGVAWAVAAYEYAVNLQQQTALAERELDARVTASQAGRVLPPSTLPPQPAPADQARNLGLWLLGGLAVVAGVLTVPLLIRK